MADYPLPSEQQALDRRRALALALQQQAYQPLADPGIPGAQISPIQGWAKIAETIVAALNAKKLDKKQAALDTRVRDARQQMAQMLAQAGAPPQTQGQEVTTPGGTMNVAPPNMSEGLRNQSFIQGMAAPDPVIQQIAAALSGQSAKRQEQAQEMIGKKDLAQFGEALPSVQAETMLRQAQAVKALEGPQQQPRNIDPLSPEGIKARVEAETQLAKLKPANNELTDENVMLDGVGTKVLKDKMGNYYDLQKKPITGRITPYIAPPTPRQRGEITPTAEAGLITQLNKQWETAAKDIQGLYRANTIMDAGLAAARRGDMNAGAQAVLVTFQKFLDPQSVVRESEYARSGEGLAMAERIRGWYEKNFQTGGAGVPLAELEKFAQLGKEINTRLAGEGTSLLSAEKKRISSIADRYNIPPDMVVTPFNFGGPAPQPTATPTAAPQSAPTGGFRIVP